MSSNRAAWLSSAGSPIHVGPAEMPTPTPNTLVIANRAVAINPVDWKQASSGLFIQSWPTILGCDTAGTVHSVGDNVRGFKVGDRVLGHCIGIKSGDNADEAFQLYSRVPVELASLIPEGMAFEEAAVVPLGLSTAAAGLYEAQHLGLPLPLTRTPLETSKVILVWGGSSSVGSSAIQLAVASGFAVVTTASEHNFGFCKGLGATRVFDHRSGSVVGDIVDVLRQQEFAGAYDAIGTSTLQIADIVAKLGGGKIATVLAPPRDGVPATVEVTQVFGIPIGNGNTVGQSIYHDFLPQALKTGQFQPLPPADVVGEGLDAIQGAMDQLKAGVSARKLVVKL